MRFVSPAVILAKKQSLIVQHSAMARPIHGWWLLSLVNSLVVALPLWGQVVAQPPAPPQATPQAPLVVRGVTVIDVRAGQRLRDQTVVIVGNRIQARGATQVVTVPHGARVVDGHGQYLIPGMWDLHVHPMQYADIAYPLFVASGVTGVRDAGSNMPLATLTRWKEEIATGARVGPRLMVSGQALEGPRCSIFAHHICVTTPADARLVVDLFHTAGADMIKTYNLSTELYYAVAAEARRLGMLFGGHMYAAGGGLMASDSGATILDHRTWFNPNVCGDESESSIPRTPSLAGCTAAAQQLRRNGTWVAVGGPVSSRVDLDTLYMLHPWTAAMRQNLSSMSADTTSETFQRSSEMFQREHAAGIPFVIGTDAFVNAKGGWPFIPGFGVAETMVALASKGGLTPLEALQTATLNPALALHMIDSLGTVDAGKVADLVLLDADPLVDITNTTKIRAVVANGRYYDRGSLDTQLGAVAAEVRRIRAATAAAAPTSDRAKRKPQAP